ncbi:MAG: ATP synthase F1 subunit delta [Deltaproteobacteria bacterium]|nr:ATP synthase F1 subunit delta [Deltaproteobacteria bacterium]
MVEGRLSRRYARALFQLALEEAREAEVGQEISRYAEVYTTSALIRVVSNRALAARARKNVVIEVARSVGLSSLMIHFLSLLVDRDRVGLLPSIASRYRRLLDEAKGRVEARVVAAALLSRDMMERVRVALQSISGKEVILHEETDLGLIGGVRIELEGRVYDGSVRTQLEKMKQRIERGY